MKVILTKKDIKKPLKINGTIANNADRESLLKWLLVAPDKVQEIIITKNCISITINI